MAVPRMHALHEGVMPFTFTKIDILLIEVIHLALGQLLVTTAYESLTSDPATEISTRTDTCKKGKRKEKDLSSIERLILSI
jgi:hypothetical protein